MMKFNRKFALLICGTMLVQGVPAEAANKELEVKEGVINEAKAFINGTYIYDGYKNEDIDSATYFSTPKGDIKIQDVNGVGDRYGTNYIDFNEDDVLFDLSKGQAAEETGQDKLDIIEGKFISKALNKADRYENYNDFSINKKLAKDCFSGVWYEGTVEGNDRKYTVYISDTGKYIDSSEILNIVYYDKSGNKIKLDTYEDLVRYNEKLDDKSKELQIIHEQGLLIDAENIYKALILLDNDKLQTLLLNDKIRDTYEDIASEDNELKMIGFLKKIGAATVYTQKISMEQGEKKDGAYLPKKVDTYEAYDLDIFTLVANPENTARIIGSNVYVVEPDRSNNEITIKKYKMKTIKDKKSFDNKILNRKVLEEDEDFNIDNENMQDFCVDTYGNIWVLSKGKVQKLVDGKFECVYSVDRSMNRLSVFDEKSMIIWNTENEIYSLVNKLQDVSINEEDKVKEEEVKEENKNVSNLVTGWIKNEDLSWSYINLDGSKAYGWVKDNGKWYFLDNKGIMKTSWVNDGSDWYYLSETGEMKTGWIKDNNGKWYYLSENGKMVYDTVVDGYKLNKNGEWIG